MSTQHGNRALRAVRFSRGVLTVGVRLSAVLGAATVLAACGADAGVGSEGAGTPPDAVVRAQDHPDLGRILVDTSGNTLYFTDEEADGEVRCSGRCLEFWTPFTIEDGAAPLVPGVDELDTVLRPDTDQTQLTYQGKPLYTFSMDEAAGEANGDNLADEFDGTRFVWHAVTIDASGATTEPPDGGGYGY
jgi:predicted lipoprotein with Yx(FWY)xxD motif